MSLPNNATNPTHRNEQRKATGQQGQHNGRKAPVSWAEKVKVTNANSRFTLEPLSRPPPGQQLVIPEEAMEDSEQWSRCLVDFLPRIQIPLPCYQLHGHESLEEQWTGSCNNHIQWLHPVPV
ncbi:hypothetical protein OIU78_023799 [Salix suchowensis]|nr:hypothetical protein OIU78_023799 [Salix suchowensis]